VDVIRLSYLKGACAEQRALFRQTFPKGAPITAEAMARARAAGLDVSWLVDRLPQFRRNVYHRARDAAWIEYCRVTAPALGAYTRDGGSARAGTAWAEYLRAIGPARAEYDSTLSAALLAALLST
jgi:hypothetical protein